jgi:regulator of protease activity HflC (stomatin/prohibitin superfamily)
LGHAQPKVIIIILIIIIIIIIIISRSGRSWDPQESADTPPWGDVRVEEDAAAVGDMADLASDAAGLSVHAAGLPADVDLVEGKHAPSEHLRTEPRSALCLIWTSVLTW